MHGSIGFFSEFEELSRRTLHRDESLRLDGIGVQTNPVCGDAAVVELDCCSGVVLALRYNAQGCWPVFGCLELAADLVAGQELEQIARWSGQDFSSWVKDVPATKLHAFSLVYRATMRAVGAALVVAGAETVGFGSKERL